MMPENYSQDYIDDLYAIGEFDITSLDFLFGAVNFGGAEDEDCLNKTDAQILKDTFTLIEYLISSGDFEIGKFIPAENKHQEDLIYRGQNVLIPYKDIEALKGLAITLYQENGFDAEPFHSEMWLVKKKLGTKAPSIPEVIKKLFMPQKNNLK